MKSKKNIEKELKKLKDKLREMKRFNRMAWDIYGSELCSYQMSFEETELEEKIRQLKEELKQI